MIMLMALFLYLYADPLLPFKSVFITAVGIVWVALLKMLYKTPRPYWINSQMNVTIWYVDYSGPSDHICIASMFYIYNIFIFLHKYVEKVNTFLIGLLLFLAFWVIMITTFGLFYLGQTFLFESFMGIVCSTLLSIVLLSIDKSIHRMVLNVWFDIYKSRRYKFVFLFVWIGISVCLMLIYNFLLIDYSVDPKWHDSKCLKERRFRYRIGIDYTFSDFTVISTLLGATFGCSYASTIIDDFLFQSTPVYKRIVRASIGVIFTLIFFKFMSLFQSDNYLTEYFWVKAIPYFAIAYLLFGYYPCMWQFLKLIEFEESENSLVRN